MPANVSHNAAKMSISFIYSSPCQISLEFLKNRNIIFDNKFHFRVLLVIRIQRFKSTIAKRLIKRVIWRFAFENNFHFNHIYVCIIAHTLHIPIAGKTRQLVSCQFLLCRLHTNMLIIRQSFNRLIVYHVVGNPIQSIYRESCLPHFDL